jgi:hypothetical protein
MRKLIIILFLWLIVISAKSQDQTKFSISLNSSYLVTDRLFTYHESDDYINYRNSKETSKPGFDCSATINYRFKNKLSFETGIGFSYIGYQTKEERIIDPGFSPLTAGFYSILYQFNYQNIYMPLHLKYSSPGKFKLLISFGPSLVFPISEDIDVILRQEYGNSDGQRIDRNTFGGHNKIRRLNTSLDLAIGCGFKLSNKVTLALNPKISYFLFSNENVWAGNYLYYLSKFGGNYKSTKENLYSMGISFSLSFIP